MTATDRSDRRYLAGLILEDATTGAPISSALRLESAAARFFRSASGVHVVSAAIGLEEHLDAFDPIPDDPAVGSVSIQVSIRDEHGFYYPRLFTLALPRNPDPSAADSVVQPVRVQLYRSLRAPSGANWAVIHGSLVGTDGAPVRNALVRVVRISDAALLGVGVVMSSGSAAQPSRTVGELAIPLAGIPAVMWSNTAEGSVLVTSVPVRLEIVAIAASLDVFDPDEFVNLQGTSTGPFSITSGRREDVGVLEVTVPS